MTRFVSFAALALALVLAAGCDDSTGITAADIACPTTPTLTYANFGQATMNTYCNECHTTRERPRLTTQAEVQAASAQVIEAAVYHSGMPEDKDMSNEVRIQLGQWLTCGAL
jgi:mono/diheme cytochrome c family protein